VNWTVSSTRNEEEIFHNCRKRKSKRTRDPAKKKDIHIALDAIKTCEVSHETKVVIVGSQDHAS
jgi:hypothetical protein